MQFSRWEIWNAIVKFEDKPDEAKRRPVLVVGNQEVFILAFKITGTELKKYRIANWAESGLYKQSYIDCDAVLKLKESDFHEKLGKLHPDDILNFQKCLRE